MLTDFLSIGGVEAWNTTRLAAYLENVGSPFDSGAEICGCEVLTRQMIEGSGEPATYDTPATDPAPWYDADLPVSGEFLGFLPLSITGLEDNPRARNVTNAVGGGGVFGPSRALPRTITVSGLLIGATCCGSEYGLHYLSEVLGGCTGDSCDGDCIEMFDCCPDGTLTPEQFEAQHKRTFRRVALVSGPTVVERTGTGSCQRGNCGAAGDIIQVEFVLVAASPWAWTDPTPLLDVVPPIGGDGDCINWCFPDSHRMDGHDCDPSECLFKNCDRLDECADPNNQVPRPPQPTVPTASFCIPLAPEEDCYSIDLTTRPRWSSDVPMITVLAGSTALRNVRIVFYERPTGTTLTCDQIADANRCAPQNSFYITFIPAGGAVTIDGQVGKATIECAGECRTASTVFGDQDGGPVKINEMTCAQYCVCIESDPLNPPAADSNISISVSGRGY